MALTVRNTQYTQYDGVLVVLRILYTLRVSLTRYFHRLQILYSFPPANKTSEMKTSLDVLLTNLKFLFDFYQACYLYSL